MMMICTACSNAKLYSETKASNQIISTFCSCQRDGTLGLRRGLGRFACELDFGLRLTFKTLVSAEDKLTHLVTIDLTTL